MQKKIIALAVAGLVSSVAFAQSNVTVYGILDAGFSSWSGNGERATGVSNGGMSTSRLGFMGEEALGNGLKATFQLETAASTDDPNSKDTLTTASTAWGGNRQANVGLTGNFGTVKLGVQQSLSDLWAGNVEVMGNLSPRNLIGNTLGRFSNEKARAASYYSPIFSGLQLAALYGTKQETDTFDLPNANKTDSSQAYYQLGANYNNGPFNAALTYAYLADDADSAKDWTIGGTYDFKVVKVFAGYERSADVGATGAATLAGSRDLTNSEWTVGVRVPVTTAGTISASYAKNSNDVNDTDVDAWLLGYDHALSKRTTLYAAYMHIGNDDASSIEPPSRFNNTNAFTSSTGESYGGVTFGLRHAF